MQKFGIIIFGLLWFGLVIFCGIMALSSGMDNGWSPTVLLWIVATLVVFAGPVAYVIELGEKENAKPFDGYVYKQTFYPATTTMVMSGKVLVPIHNPERYNLVLKNADGEARSCDVSQEEYERVSLGQPYHCGGF